MQLGFYFDQTRCSECGTCVVSCKDWNSVKPGIVKWRKIHDYDTKETGTYPNITFRPLVFSCGHCDNPACVAACPSKAVTKREEDGIVIVDRNKCTGAQSCIAACPYGAVQIADDSQETSNPVWNTAHPAQKCTFCLDRILDNNKPSCVMGCPQRALDAGPKDYILQRYPDAVPAVEVEGFPADIFNGGHTSPNLYIKRK